MRTLAVSIPAVVALPVVMGLVLAWAKPLFIVYGWRWVREPQRPRLGIIEVEIAYYGDKNLLGVKVSASARYIEPLVENDLSDDELSEYRCSTVGFMFQMFYLIARLTMLENVELPLIAREMSREDRRESSKGSRESRLQAT